MRASVHNTRLVYHNDQASTLIAIVLFAAISLLAISAVFIRYSWDPLVAFAKRRQHRRSQHHSRAFFHTQLGAYVASLMLSNAFSSISFIIDGDWAALGAVTAGTLCNTQGILAQIGDTGGAYFTAAVAIHTFNTLVLRNKLAGWICLVTIVVGWLVAILLAATPTWIHNRVLGPVYGINGLSCGISTNWPVVNSVLRVLPLVLGSILSVGFYTLIFLVLRGTLRIKNGIKFNMNRAHRWSMSSATTVEYQRFIAAVARSMLWYPFAFNILLLPAIIVSLADSSGLTVPFPASVFAACTASLLGVANALILCNTLRILRPFLDGNMAVGNKPEKDADMESFFAGAKSPTLTQSPSTPRNPEKAFVNNRDSDVKRAWTPPPRSTSKPATATATATVAETVVRSISRVSRSISLKRKGSHSTTGVVAPAELARSITPVSELNAKITVPEPARKKVALPASPRPTGASPTTGLPRRATRSPLIRKPTLPSTEQPSQTIDLKTPEPPRKAASPKTGVLAGSRHTSANDSLLSMYLSRTPEQAEMEKPVPPPKLQPLAKSRPQPIPLSARSLVKQNSLAPSPLPSLFSARPAGSTSGRDAYASSEWLERVRRGAPTPSSAAATATSKAERRRSRSLDLTASQAQPRTLMYGDSLAPVATPRRDVSLSAVAGRTPTSARRLPGTPSRAGSTSGAYGYI